MSVIFHHQEPTCQIRTKAHEYMKRFNKMLTEDARIRSTLSKLISYDCTCKKAAEYVVCSAEFICSVTTWHDWSSG